MKNTYTNPDMNISVFDSENIVIDNSTVQQPKMTAAEYAKQNAAEIFKKDKIEAILVF